MCQGLGPKKHDEISEIDCVVVQVQVDQLWLLLLLFCTTIIIAIIIIVLIIIAIIISNIVDIIATMSPGRSSHPDAHLVRIPGGHYYIDYVTL